MTHLPPYHTSPLSREIEDLGKAVLDAAVAVHRELGPGLLERTYQVCLAHELRKQGIDVGEEVPVPVEYDGVRLDAGYRIDLLVGDSVVVELKAVEALTSVHTAQLMTQLKLSGYRLGFLLNFNQTRVLKQFKRLVV